MFLKNKKGQITLEFIVIIGVILLFGVLFYSSIFSIIQSNKAVYLVKQNSLDLISYYNYPTTLSRVHYVPTPEGVSFIINLKKNNGPETSIAEETILNPEHYRYTLDYIEETTSYENLIISFTYD